MIPLLNLSPCHYPHCVFSHAPLIDDGGKGRTLPGHKVRMCPTCEVTWYGSYTARCWVCEAPGSSDRTQGMVAA